MMPPIFMLISLLLPTFVDCRIEEIPLPPDMQACFDNTLLKGNLTTLIGEKIVWRCVQGTLWTRVKQTKAEIPKVAMRWFADLIHKGYREAQQRRRIRRQAFGRRRPRQLRVRREYRMLSDEERNNFHRALNMLKTDVSIPPNRFDALGWLHEMLGDRSHDGPNFLGWHRLFLIVAENALREKIPSVTIPYWDSTLDGGLVDPRASVMWSPEFMGNGNGRLRTGPLTGWATPYGPLIRNFGDGGTMMNWTSLRDTFSRNHLADITHPNALPKYNIEDHHGEPHLWVGGHMSPQALAGYDPVFLMHHSFMDLLWELFRRVQRRRGVDPTTDYPRNNTGPPGQAYYDPSGFGSLLNRHSLSDIFTTEMYTYQLPPTCTRNQTTCGSRYIRCDTSGIKPRCVSASVFDTPASEIFDIDAIIDAAGVRKKRNAHNDTHESMYIHNEHHVNAYVQQLQAASDVKCQPESINEHYVNNYNIDGVTDKKLWSYIPVKVIIRQKSTEKNAPAQKLLSESYSKCTDGSKRPFRVFLEANGLNYRGFYKEIAHAQNDISVFSTLSYVGVRTPNLKASETVITAYDSCGRACRVFCPSEIGDIDRPCSGALRITTDLPTQYGSSVSSVSEMLWHDNSYGVPDVDKKLLFVKVLCDGQSEWPWK